ncbi:hypothetical protein [Phenylobacterium sp.]|jgi:hypothetical protein|uniref:hypothetical protein n=1 Tax=Phenylobacterium sp. TaxID=1871053 RepID=UPI000C8958E9|nr:hypothetical protein [Phenylobacterium sp.]MAK82928.1 hypothetical protein [Phenylobacterium sp.]|tara:strand:+ start:1698 stop:2084 length:387 start_codon:yes stop_codon:yes gene_type:complete
MLRTAILLGVCALALAACQKRTYPPGDPGVCYQVVRTPEGALKYNRIPGTQPDLEHCAAALEAIRIRFLQMGGSTRTLVGAYQGNFIFVQREGIFTSRAWEQNRYLALVRTGDGRLAIPGAMPQQPAP